MATPSEDFQAFPKIPRLSKECMVITEKIDGTNAQLWITPDGNMKIGSRNRWITPEDDNYGFARWATENKEELLKLGHGRHFGEWWGLGIQRGYGQTEKRFSLFNTMRPNECLPSCVSKVPVLYHGEIDTDVIKTTTELLRRTGSVVAPGFMNPEGVVVFYPTSCIRYKKLLENDSLHKGEVQAVA